MRTYARPAQFVLVIHYNQVRALVCILFVVDFLNTHAHTRTRAFVWVACAELSGTCESVMKDTTPVTPSPAGNIIDGFAIPLFVCVCVGVVICLCRFSCACVCLCVAHTLPPLPLPAAHIQRKRRTHVSIVRCITKHLITQSRHWSNTLTHLPNARTNMCQFSTHAGPRTQHAPKCCERADTHTHTRALPAHRNCGVRSTSAHIWPRSN